jgi:hypothetical protein
MDPISKLSKLLETIRAQQLSDSRINSRKVSDSIDLTQPGKSNNLNKKLTSQQLSKRIHDRINHLPTSERYGSKAIQVFVDSVLAWEFGEDLLQSDSFFKYSDKIRDVISNDENLSHEFELFLKEIANKTD